MIAIIQKTGFSDNPHIKLVGTGASEHEARIEAAHSVKGGFCAKAEYEGKGYEGGESVKIAPALSELLSSNNSWDDTFNEDGDLVESSANQLHFDQMAALSRLFINKKGQLDACMQEQLP